MSTLNRCAALIAFAGMATTALATPPWELIINSNIGLGAVPPDCTLGEVWNMASGPFNNPRIDNAGRMLVDGQLDSATNPGGTVTTANRRVYIYGVPGNVRMIARDGQSGVAPNTFTSLNLANPNNWWHNTTTNAAGLVTFPTLSPNGMIFCASNLNGTGATTTNNTAFFTGTYDLATGTKTLAVVAQRGVVPTGGIAPGTVGALWNTNMSISTSQYGVNDNGQVVFQSALTGGDVSGTTNNDGLWIGKPGDVRMLMRKGQTAPANVGDATLLMDAAPTFGMFTNNRGEAFWVSKYRSATGTGATAAVLNSNQNAIFVWSNGTLSQLLRQGQQLPHMAAGVTPLLGSTAPFSHVNGGFTNTGKILIHCQIAGPGITTGVNDRTIMQYEDGTWTTRFQAGVTSTGIPGVEFANVNISNTRANGRGSLLIPGNLTGPGVTAGVDDQAHFFMSPAGELTLIYRLGSLLNLPGLPADATWSGGLSAQSGVGMNDLNQVVWQGSVVSSEYGTAPNNTRQAVFGWTPKDGMMLLAVAGSGVNNQFVNDLGSDATQLTINPTTNGAGGCAGFSDSGWLVMRATDGFNHQGIYRLMLPSCVGDYNANGSVDGDDVIAFFSDWDAANSRADANKDGSVDGDDVIAFFGAWDQGC